MSIEFEISRWDGKSADDIRAIHNRYCAKEDYVNHLVDLILNSELRTGATWLLKATLESGATITQSRIAQIYASLEKLDYWEQKLHVLQCIEFMPIEARQTGCVEIFLRACLSHDNKFVRAWAYSGYYCLAKQHKEFREEVTRLFEMALRDEAASVKARVRKVAKDGF